MPKEKKKAPEPRPAAVEPVLTDAALRAPELYVNRELSLLEFQRRVLEEAADARNPLLERAKFLSILGSNLDEFFMVRVAGLIAQVDAGTQEVGPDGMTPGAQLVAIRREVKRLVAEGHRVLRSELIPALEEAGIRVLDYSQLLAKQTEAARKYFDETIYPVLTPLAFDPGRPFPHISNLSLNLAVLIRDPRGAEHFARVKVPDSLPQLIPVNRTRQKAAKPGRAAKRIELVWIEQVIAANIGALFPGMEVLQAHPFHVTRDADIAIKELEAEDLLETIEEGVRQRRFGSVVRLKVGDDMPQHILEILMSNLEIEPSQVYRVKGPLALKRLMALYQLERPELKEIPFLPAVPPALTPASEDEDVFTLIRRQDILLHHPFESFSPVVDFLRKAARDKDVLAIKMCLYRVGRNAPVVEALLDANQRGKQVAVLVELKARFDEESNIEWARALESEGVHVVYGLLGLKIHCKVAMVVRREGDAMRRYVHMSTGNYNAFTAHLYTDIGMFTADPVIADDVSDLFNYLTGYSAKKDYQKLLVAPVNLRDRIVQLIEQEVRVHQESGGGGHMILKMNSVVDPKMIQALYRASAAGVKVDLLVRGVCCLRPGLKGISETVEVTSIVGRFLEHDRAYYFRNGGDERIYLGSADMMQRNLNRRVEVLFPVGDARLIKRIKDSLNIYLADNVKARRMNPDGTYTRKAPGPDGKKVVNAQALLMERVRQKAAGS